MRLCHRAVGPRRAPLKSAYWKLDGEGNMPEQRGNPGENDLRQPRRLAQRGVGKIFRLPQNGISFEWPVPRIRALGYIREVRIGSLVVGRSFSGSFT